MAGDRPRTRDLCGGRVIELSDSESSQDDKCEKERLGVVEHPNVL